MGSITFFGKPLTRAFKKRCDKQAFYDNQKKIGCHNYHKGGNQILFVSIQHTPIIEWQLKFFNRLRRHCGDDFFFKNDGEFFQLPQKGVVSYVFGKPSMTLWLPML
jgi:hypothetical protein